MGTLAEMRHLSALTVEATFAGAIPDLSAVPGVTRGGADGRRALSGARIDRAIAEGPGGAPASPDS